MSTASMAVVSNFAANRNAHVIGCFAPVAGPRLGPLRQLHRQTKLQLLKSTSSKIMAFPRPWSSCIATLLGLGTDLLKQAAAPLGANPKEIAYLSAP
jgi:hypothetical protein